MCHGLAIDELHGLFISYPLVQIFYLFLMPSPLHCAHSNDIRLLFDLTEPLTYPHCLYSLSKRDFFIFFLSDPQQPSYRAQTKTQKTKTKTKKPTTVFQPLAPVSADLVQEVR